MSIETVTGFWSYSRDDNSLDGGGILELARLLREEYNLLSGEPLELFIDHDSVAWGEQWRERIDSSLSQTTFFIPIITPRYFTRPECRRELLEFAAKAKSLGVEELILPILYVEIQGLSPENPDEAVALIAKTQYVDWRAIRLLETTSQGYRTAVNALARRLLEITQKVTEKQFNLEVSVDLEDDGVDGITDIVEKITKFLPDWVDAVQGENINLAQADATWHQLWPRVTKLQKSGAPASAILATQMRAAREMLPLLERSQRDFRTYAARSVELDPLITQLAGLVAEHPESFSLAMPVREAIDEAMSQIRKNDEESGRPGAHGVDKHFDEMRHLGRIFQKCAAINRDAGRAWAEGSNIVKRWDSELRRPE